MTRKKNKKKKQYPDTRSPEDDVKAVTKKYHNIINICMDERDPALDVDFCRMLPSIFPDVELESNFDD